MDQVISFVVDGFITEPDIHGNPGFTERCCRIQDLGSISPLYFVQGCPGYEKDFHAIPTSRPIALTFLCLSGRLNSSNRSSWNARIQMTYSAIFMMKLPVNW